jgi:sugar phosphate isomerase/epimerase
MYLTGFADEAATGIDGQIRATKELGWQNIESRNIDGKNIHDLSDKEFDIVYGKLQEAGIKINCFGSAIANWAKGIDQPFDSSLAEARRAIPRMKKLGTRLIRIMSFTLLKDRGPEDQMEQERFRRLRELQKMFADEGLTPVNENCMNYGGMGWTYALRMVENVPGLKIVFDTGNPVSSDNFSATPPYPKQSAWEFYSHVKEHVVYIHVKDGVWDKVRNQMTHTFPGEGQGDVRKILKDMFARGYNDGISIEPHMAALAHDKSVQSPEEIKYSNYVEYGRRLMKMLAERKKQ